MTARAEAPAAQPAPARGGRPGPVPQTALAETLMSLAADYAIAHRAFVTAPNEHTNAKFDTARRALRFEVDCLAARCVREAAAVTLQAIANFPVTDPKNMDAVNMAAMARAALTAQPAETCQNPQLAPDRKLSFTPTGCAYLFIQMDDAGRAHVTACADEAAVLTAVISSMWVSGYELDDDEQQQAQELVQTLLEDGRMSFEGDPPIYLFRLAATPITPSVPIR